MRIGRHRNSSRARDFLSELRTAKNPATPRTQIHPNWKSLGPVGKATRGSRNNVFSSLIWRKVRRTAVASAISDNQNSRPTTAERGIALLPGPRRYKGARRRARSWSRPRRRRCCGCQGCGRRRCASWHDLGVSVAQSKDKRPDCFPIEGISLSHHWSRSRCQLHTPDTCSEPRQCRRWNRYRNHRSPLSRSARHRGRRRCWLSSPRSR
jgi:hypothetical protein